MPRKISRRLFLTLSGATGTAIAVGCNTSRSVSEAPSGSTAATSSTATGANTGANKIVLVNWGGDAVDAFSEAWGKPFTDKTGIPVEIDGTGPAMGKIKAMVQSNSVTWDVCDADPHVPLILGRQGLLEPLDYTKIDRSKVPAEFTNEWGIASYLFSYVLAYDTEALKDRTPQNWADFWNTQEFPGKRTLYKDIQATLEVALLADGVPPAQLYPLDVRRALAKIKQIKADLIFWGTGAESQQLLRDREVSMGCIWSTRASVVERDTDQRIQFTWNQGIVLPGMWVVPKGNPAGAKVMDFIASTQQPDTQVALLTRLGNGPANPDAADLVPGDLKRLDPATPENFAKQIPLNIKWVADNYEEATQQFLDMVSS